MADLSDVLNALKSAALTALYPPILAIGGTATAGDVLSVTATPAKGAAFTFAYTVGGADTLADMASGLKAALQNSAPLLCGLSATVSGTVLTFAATPGFWSLAASVTGAGSETLMISSVPAGNLSPVAEAAVLAVSGWPVAGDLDAVAASVAAPPVRAIVSAFAAPGRFRDTTRYPLEWTAFQQPTPTLAIAVSGTAATISGTPGGGQVVALIIGFAASRKAYAYAVQANDTLASVAANLAALIAVDTAATASGATITVPAAFSLIGRVGVVGVAMKELRRQMQRFWLTIWAPSPAVREAVAAPIAVGLANTDFLTLADGTAARVVPCGDDLLDDPQKANLYRRCLAYDIEYPTTITLPASEIVVFEQQLTSSEAAQSGFTLDVSDISGNDPLGPSHQIIPEQNTFF